MKTPTKQAVYLPVNDFNSSERAICTIGIPDLYGDKVVEQQGYFFTPEQLNEYTQSVIKQALETAAEKATMRLLVDEENDIIEEANIDKKSITNTFEETYKYYKV